MPTSTTNALKSEIYRETKPPLHLLRVVVRVPVEASDRMAESSNAAAATRTATMQQPPSRKKQKVDRKIPPDERMQRILSDESKVSTVHGTSGGRSESRLLQRKETGAPRQIPFNVSPRQHPMSSSNFIVASESRLLQSDHALNRPHPIQYYESSMYAGQHQNIQRQSVIDLVSSIQSTAFPLHSASMAAPRPLAATNSWFRGGQAFASPPSRLDALDVARYLTAGYISSSENTLAFHDCHSLAQSKSTSSDIQSPFHPSRATTQLMEDTLRIQQESQYQVVGALTEQLVPPTLTTRSTFPLGLPALMGHSSDVHVMNAHQVYLREQIEVFEATQDDLCANARGRHKRIHVGQVGIRCRHCAHIPAKQRQMATMYFPATMRGLYQAAQNMSTNHIQCGLCAEMPESVKTRFVELWPTRNTVSRVGRRYWEETAGLLGLVDTENGIVFQPHSVT